MAEKIVIAELDINMEQAIKDTIKLKEEIKVLSVQTAKALEEQGALSAEYIQYSAALKGTQADLKKQETLLVKITQANVSQNGSIEQARLQLAVVAAEWAKVTKIEGENSERSKELTEEKLRLKTAITELEKATGTYTGEVGNYENATKSIRKEIKELTAAIVQAKIAGDENSESVQKQKERLGLLKDAMGDTAAEAKLLGSDTRRLDMAVGTFTAMGSAAQVAEGSIALLGIENDEVAKSIQKMVAIQSVLNGVQEIGNALQKESAFMMTVTSVKTKAVAAAQWLWNTALAANPIMLVVAGIAALGSAIALLTIKFKSNAEQIASYKSKLQELQKQSEYAQANMEFETQLLQAKGKTEKEITEQAIKDNKLVRENLQAQIKVTDDLQNANKKNYEEYKKYYDEGEVLRKKVQDTYGQDAILSAKYEELKRQEKKKTADEAKKNDEETFKSSIETASKIYEYNKTLRDKATNATEKNYDKLIATERALYIQGSAIAKKELEGQVISQAEYGQKVVQLQMERDANIQSLNQERAEKAVAVLDYEFQAWQLQNKEKISQSEILTKELIAQEEKRLIESQTLETTILKQQFESKLITQNEYNLKVLELEVSKNESIAELNKQYDEQEKANKLEAAKIDFDNQQALFEEYAFAQLDRERALNESKRLEEIKAAEKVGADVNLINKKYQKANLALDKAEKAAKLSLAMDFASNVATIAGENTKVGKAAAAAAATINTYQAATGAYAALAPIPIVGPALGIAAAAAAVVSGISQVKKILSTNPGSTPSTEGGAGTTGSTQGLTSSLQSVNTELGQGIVSRSIDTGGIQATGQRTPVLVVDDVTNKQNIENAKVETSTI